MNVMTKMIIPFSVLVYSGLTCANTNASEVYDKLYQEMEIMSGIIKTSSQKQSLQNMPRVHGIESSYLSGQGAVFNVKVSRSRHSYSHFMPKPPIAPLPPKGFDNEELFGEDFEIVIEEAIEDANEAMVEAQELMIHKNEEHRRLREQERELASELRDIERERRNLNYRKLHLEEKDKADVEKELAHIDKKRKALDEERAKLNKKNKAYQEKLQVERMAREKEQKAFFANLEQSITTVLCNYGGGLRTLPKNEHVTIVFEGAGDKVMNRVRDNVLVFKKADIRSCVIESITPEKLLTKAIKYQF